MLEDPESHERISGLGAHIVGMNSVGMLFMSSTGLASLPGMDV